MDEPQIYSLPNIRIPPYQNLPILSIILVFPVNLDEYEVLSQSAPCYL